MIISPEKTVLFVPSEKVSVSIPQSSTSTGLAFMNGRSCGGREAATLPHVRRHRSYSNALAARARLDLFEIEHGRERVTPHADERTTARHRPLGGMGGMRTAVALLGFHE